MKRSLPVLQKRFDSHGKPNSARPYQEEQRENLPANRRLALWSQTKTRSTWRRFHKTRPILPQAHLPAHLRARLPCWQVVTKHADRRYEAAVHERCQKSYAESNFRSLSRCRESLSLGMIEGRLVTLRRAGLVQLQIARIGPLAPQFLTCGTGRSLLPRIRQNSPHNNISIMCHTHIYLEWFCSLHRLSILARSAGRVFIHGSSGRSCCSSYFY